MLRRERQHMSHCEPQTSKVSCITYITCVWLQVCIEADRTRADYKRPIYGERG